MFWAPQGQFVILAQLKSAEGPLEFIDTTDFSIMNAITPEMTTDIEWDPTGRYVIGAVSAWTGKVVSRTVGVALSKKLLCKYYSNNFCP
jgi:translation initiation factor 3 subunit B